MVFSSYKLNLIIKDSKIHHNHGFLKKYLKLFNYYLLLTSYSTIQASRQKTIFVKVDGVEFY